MVGYFCANMSLYVKYIVIHVDFIRMYQSCLGCTKKGLEYPCEENYNEMGVVLVLCGFVKSG